MSSNIIDKLSNNLPTWEKLAKQIIWSQLSNITDKNILDFGSGNGVTAAYLSAQGNTVTAVEPSDVMLKNRCTLYNYDQTIGDITDLKVMKAESFDVVICHNVLEYASEREDLIREFYRVLKSNGILSIVKHNRNGRIMQMAVLLNQFDTANRLLDGENSRAEQFGEIKYYELEDVLKQDNCFSVEKIYGIRTFWDLQQNQEIQADGTWQKNMIQLEKRVSEIDSFRQIAFFHHIILKKMN